MGWRKRKMRGVFTKKKKNVLAIERCLAYIWFRHSAAAVDASLMNSPSCDLLFSLYSNVTFGGLSLSDRFDECDQRFHACQFAHSRNSPPPPLWWAAATVTTATRLLHIMPHFLNITICVSVKLISCIYKVEQQQITRLCVCISYRKHGQSIASNWSLWHQTDYDL